MQGSCNENARSRKEFIMLYLILILYLLVINVIGFLIMGIDKKRAIRGAYRISEATLFTIALIGGSIGTIRGMYHYRHKTKHWYFKVGLPTILVIQCIIITFCIYQFK